MSTTFVTRVTLSAKEKKKMKKKHERRPANTHTASRRSVWRAELSCPGGGGGLHEVRRWACCGLCVAHRRAESRFWGVFIIAVLRAFVLGLGARHRGRIVELSRGCG